MAGEQSGVASIQSDRIPLHGVTDLVGNRARRLFDHADAGRAMLCHALATAEDQLAAALRRNDALHAHLARLEDEAAALRHAVVQARQFAHHDELTGLPNRVLLQDRFDQAAALAARQGRKIALLFLDLDGFKRVNDVLGHAAGDEVLQHAAARLAACIRTSDTACRYGGDEFVVLLPETGDATSALAAAEKIRAQLAAPYFVDGTAIRLTTSAGVAFYPDDAVQCRDVIRVADLAMYRDKARAPAPPALLAPAQDT